MVHGLRAGGDRLLAALLPKQTAHACYCWAFPSSSCADGGLVTCCHYPENNNITYCWCGPS